MELTKLETLGRDFLCLAPCPIPREDLPELARQLCDRRRGVGGDGLISFSPGGEGDFDMTLHRPDGSPTPLCPDAARCLAMYVRDGGLTPKACLTLTSGPQGIRLEVTLRGDRVALVTQDLGTPRHLPPVEPRWEGVTFPCRPVELGGRWALFLCPDPALTDPETLGPPLSAHPLLPPGCTPVFGAIRHRDRLCARIWDPHLGPIPAGGPGAGALFALGRRLGRCDPQVTVRMEGGSLWAEEGRGGQVVITAPVRRVCQILT